MIYQETVENGSVGYGVSLLVLVLWLLSFAVFFPIPAVFTYFLSQEDVVLHVITYRNIRVGT